MAVQPGAQDSTGTRAGVGRGSVAPSLVDERARPLGSLDATLLVMGGIIGVGIFFQPSGVAQLVREPVAYVALWAVGGLLALCGAFTFAEWGATLPRAGGWFEYLREAFGRRVAFLFAWIVLLVVSTGALAILAGFCAGMLARLFPVLGAQGSAAQLAVAAALIASITALAAAGIRVGARFQNVCMVTKLAALLVLAVLGLFFAAPGSGALEHTVAAAPPPPLARGLVQAMLPVLFTYGGWQMLGYTAAAVREPARTLPRAILVGVVCVIAVYLVVNIAYLRVLGIDGLAAAGPGFAADVARRTLGESGEKLLAAAMAVSAAGIVTVIVLATPWIYVAMSRAGLFFRAFGAVHTKSGAPRLALLTQGAIALLYLGLAHAFTSADGANPVDYLTGAVVFTEWIFHALAAWGLLRLRRLRPDLERPFRSPTIFPVVYLALAIVVVAGNLWQGERHQIGTGLVVIALGAVAYAVWKPGAREL